MDETEKKSQEKHFRVNHRRKKGLLRKNDEIC